MSRHEWRVWLQTVGVVFIPVVIIASSSHASVGQAPPGQAQTPPLRGITKVTTLVAVTFPEGKARPFGLTEDRLRTILELRLRTAGLQVLSADEDRAEIIEVIPGITRVILHYGFMQYPTIYEGLILACKQGKLPGIDLTDITYYIGRETIIPREDIPGMWVWREALFAFLQRDAERSAAFFGVPTKQVVEFGTEIEI